MLLEDLIITDTSKENMFELSMLQQRYGHNSGEQPGCSLALA